MATRNPSKLTTNQSN